MAAKKIDVTADVKQTTAAGSFIKTTKGEEAPKHNKERRVQILVVPDEWKKFQAFAHLAGSNCNALIGSFVHYTVEKYADKIKKYEKERDMMRAEVDFIEEGDK